MVGGELVECFKASVGDKLSGQTADIDPVITINGISVTVIEQFGKYEPADGDFIYLDFDHPHGISAVSATPKPDSKKVSKNAEVVNSSS